MLLADIAGLWMTWQADLWWRFADPAQRWMRATLVLHRRFARSPDPARDWQRMVAAQRVLLHQ